MTEEPYGAKGCSCWPDELDVSTGLDGFVTRVPGRWMPNAACRFHGLLADYAPDRTDTGVYRVIRADDGKAIELEPMKPTPGLDDLLRRGVEQAERGETKDRGDFSQYLDEECTGCGVRQDFLGRCEECLEDADAWTVRHTLTPEEAKAMSEAMADPDAPRRRLPPRRATAESVEWLRQRGVGEPEGGFTQDMANALMAALADTEPRPDFVDTYANPSLIGPKDKEHGDLSTVRRWLRWIADAWSGRPGWH